MAAVLVLGAALAAVGVASDGAPVPYSLTARQAQEVGAVAGFISAFDGRRIQRALGYLAAGVQITDCDYKHVKVVEVTGKVPAKTWLLQRFADRDTLLIGHVYNENADQPEGTLGIEWAKRRSKTLSALGYPAGITPSLDAKVVFATTGQPLIVRFANGPFGGSTDACHP